ncbi:MAG TPA: DMT family transporter [Candidatus Acidoferrum sp.]|nr:DMT family transporter [Candidatus Acidoferrum sp.]
MSFLLPLLSAVIYVAGALFLKRAGELGAGIWRIAWVCNFTAALVFVPMALLGGTLRPWHDFWQPAVVALLFVAGQVFTFRSLEVGDISVATPVLGLKIILVGFFTTVLLRDQLTPTLWIAAVLSTAAVALLNITRGTTHRRIGLTIAMSSFAAIAYALFDVLVQRWSPSWGIGRFLPVMMAFVALYSLPICAFSEVRRSNASFRPAARWLMAGALCFAVQSIMFVSTIALFGEATVANVLYSARGLFSVLAVWLVGHWFKNREQHLGPRVLTWRLCGAALLMLAIALVLLGRRSGESHVGETQVQHVAFTHPCR